MILIKNRIYLVLDIIAQYNNLEKEEIPNV